MPPENDGINQEIDGLSAPAPEGDDSDLVWGEEDAGVPDEQPDQPEPPAETGSKDGDIDWDALFASVEDDQSANEMPLPASQQPQTDDRMPELFDPELLEPGRVQLGEGQIKLYFEGAMQQPVTPQSYQQMVNVAYQASAGALRMKAEYSKMTAVAKGLFDQLQQVTQQIEPYKRVQSARMLANKLGIKKADGSPNVEALLRHPRTGKVMRHPETILAVASMLAEDTKGQAVAARKGVDRPVAVSSGSTGRGVGNLDPFGKDFAALERQVEQAASVGRRVRVG